MKTPLLFLLSFAFALGIQGQGMTDAYKYSATQLKGTARFMSMGGAFGALGGDLTSLLYNPAGIGVYRNSDISFTLSLQSVNAHAQTRTPSLTDNVTHLSFDNIGYVATINLASAGEMESISFGFSYNQLCNFNRTFFAAYTNPSASLGNFVAENTTDDFHVLEDAEASYRKGAAPWLSILAYQSYLITPKNRQDDRYFDTTAGYIDQRNTGLLVKESGRIDEYSFNIGGAFSNFLFWGLGVGISNISYSMNSVYTDKFSYNEAAIKSLIPPSFGSNYPSGGSYILGNELTTKGLGFNLKLGFIGRIGDVLRLGAAVHTPTFYELNDRYSADVSYENMPNPNPSPPTLPGFVSGNIITPRGYMSYQLKTPWRFIGSAAFVIGKKGIISADYELVQYKGMSLGDGYGQYVDNLYIDNSYQIQHAIRLGGEFRVTPSFSLRAGYALYLSPVKQEVRDGKVMVATAGTIPQYSLANNTSYYTAGLGYRWKHMYLDLAYSYRCQSENLFPFSPTDTASPEIAKLTTNTHSVILTAGVKF